MNSPSMILLFALCVAAVVAYFGEQILDTTDAVAERDGTQMESASGKLVYGTTRMADNTQPIRIPVSRDGHYRITLEVNGTPVHFVVDTGASHVSLRYEDALAAGLDPAGLSFDRVFRTANGKSHMAVVLLDRMALEGMPFSSIPASVSQAGRLDVSLLGMNFLSRLSSFKFEGGELLLTP
ncbi:retropepsin-like aspartic protease family protein [Paremcibacter congregatus]|uniref:retropepsin-like aspartic protease family protein n=1 Tax=Paremcibacter congregatus TaxID=2043170 RepID=UPI0030EEADF2